MIEFFPLPTWTTTGLTGAAAAEVEVVARAELDDAASGGADGLGDGSPGRTTYADDPPARDEAAGAGEG